MATHCLPIEKIEQCDEMHKKTFFPSRFNFLRAHCGIRPGCLHMIIGTKGCGKTSIGHTVAVDCASRAPITLWLSEESQENYERKLCNISKGNRENYRFIIEKDLKHNLNRTHSEFIKLAEREILDANTDIVLIDNITTSRFYSSEKNQLESAEWFNSFPQRSGVAIVAFAHTMKEVTDNYRKIISAEDSRGRNDVAMRAEYIYTLQKFTHDDGWHLVVVVEKSRHHELGGSRYFLLDYREGYYYRDAAINFERFNEIFKSREYLGRR